MDRDGSIWSSRSSKGRDTYAMDIYHHREHHLQLCIGVVDMLPLHSRWSSFSSTPNMQHHLHTCLMMSTSSHPLRRLFCTSSMQKRILYIRDLHTGEYMDEGISDLTMTNIKCHISEIARPSELGPSRCRKQLAWRRRWPLCGT